MSDNSEDDSVPPQRSQPGSGNVPQSSPSPYGYGPPAPANPRQKNYLGILSLIFPFVALSLVGIIMGHLGLSAVKKGEASNRGVALAGTIVSWVFTVLTVLGILTVVALPAFLHQQNAAETSVADPEFDPSAAAAHGGDTATPGSAATPGGSGNPTDAANPDGLVAFSELAIGDCIADPYDNVVQEVTGASAVAGVKVVDCADPHYGEVYAVGAMEAASFVEDEIFSQADDLCFFAFEDFMGISYADSMYYYEPYYPSAEGWRLGDRETTCVVTSYASDTVGTLKDSGL